MSTDIEQVDNEIKVCGFHWLVFDLKIYLD